MSSSESSKDRFAPLTYEQMYCVEEPEPDGRPLELEIDSLVPFPNQPFDPYTEDEMAQMVESIQENGVISPIIVRPKADGETYEIISGHNRVEACRRAGICKIPSFIREVDDDTAVILMVDSNLRQREELSEIEKGRAYALKLEALDRKLGRPLKNVGQVVPHFQGKRSTAIVGEENGDIFAVIPDNDTSLSYLVGMLYTQIIQELYYQADHVYRGRLPIHARMILDEFANVSLPEEFDKSLATMRSREISATIIVQNLAQLKGLYKEHGWETITGNCDTLLYLGGNEQSTHEYISKLLGKETIDTRTHGQTKGKSGSYSTNMQTTGRELMTPDEVRLLDNSKALLFIRGFPAVMDDKYDLNRHPNIRKTVNGGYPPYIHKAKAYPYIPFDKAFDFENAERYIYLENEMEEPKE